MEVFFVQLTTLLSLLLGNFLVGHIPFLIISRVSSGEQAVFKKSRIVAFLSHLGGGVFMSICLIVLLPESREKFEHHEEALHLKDKGASTTAETPSSSHQDGFPIPEFIMLCSFFGTFAIQEVLHYLLYHFRRKNTKSDARVRFCSCAKRHTECSRTFKADHPEQTMFGLEKNKYLESTNSGLAEEYSALDQPQETPTHMTTNLLQSSMISHPVPNYGSVTNATTPRTNTPVPVPPLVIADHGNVGLVQPKQTSSHNTAATSNILLLITLSFHAILQGMVLGQRTSTLSWALLLVGCVQQTVVVFVMGSVAIYSSQRLWFVMGFVVVISAMSPLGIGLTMVIEEEISNVPYLFYGTVDVIICGALMYLTFYDLLRRRNIGESPHGSKFVGFTLGAGGMASLQYLFSILR